ncbi:retinol dehydrogenase 12-like [Lineus longissimus]|uniref:retinol dehydrogenase 12-like n=1 Tax=Lineus longissimus TaxID=88925 RepID=UPI00315C9FC0
MNGGVCRITKRLDGKTVVITGANTGIGKETARDLIKRGARVVLACRDRLRGEEAVQELCSEVGKPGLVALYKLDLANISSIHTFVEEFISKEERLDILINNAGVMWCPYARTDDGFEMQIGVNHLGHFLLTNLLLDKMVASSPSRIINLTSIAHYDKRALLNFDDLMNENNYQPAIAYAQSKLANVLFTKELARRLEGTGVTANAVHPGVVRTELGRYMDILKRPMVRYFLFPMLQPIIWLVTKSPTQGSQTSIYCAVADELVKTSGKYFSDCAEKDAAIFANDEESAKRLWEMSEKLVHLDDVSLSKKPASSTAASDEESSQVNVSSNGP